MTACSHSPSQAGSATPTGPAPSASASPRVAAGGVENLVVAESVRLSLISAYASHRQISETDISGTAPHSVYYAIDHSTGIHWAIASFTPSPSASQSVRTDYQNDALTAMFQRQPGAAWSVADPGEPSICSWVKYFPSSVLTAWNIPAQPSACPNEATGTGAVPVLGRPWGPGVKGYGEIRPTEINNNGDATSFVRNISWDSWGGEQAVGHGTAYYVAPNQSSAQATPQAATVVAFMLAACGGKTAYGAVEWYFPQHGGHFSSSSYRDTCSGTYVGNAP